MTLRTLQRSEGSRTTYTDQGNGAPRVLAPDHRRMVDRSAPDQVTAALRDWLTLPVGSRRERHPA